MTPALRFALPDSSSRAKSLALCTRSVLATVSLLAAFGCAAQPALDIQNASPSSRPDLSAAEVEIATVSSRPDMVTGGDALVRFVLPAGTAASQVRVTVNGTDVTSAFRAEPNGPGMLGVVTGLRQGRNTIAVQDGTGTLKELVVTNHPAYGPVFSGPHETPFICETDSFKLLTDETLGPPLDEHCSAKRRVYYAYRSVNGGELKPLPNVQSGSGASAPSTVSPGTNPALVVDGVRIVHPPDVAVIKNSLGVEVPYIVRIETGTANRAIYEIAILHDPFKEPEPTAWSQPGGWNRRLIFTLGGGCPGGWYRQGMRTGGVRGDELLRLGYAVASSTLNVFGNNCSDLIASETAMLVKERFIEAYGAPLHTVGTGCSGGSYQGLQAVDNYPGIYDGVIVGCSYPDVQFGTTPWNSDARLLLQYFNGKSAEPWSHAQQLATIGFVNLDIMELIGKDKGHAQRIRVGEACPPVLPEALKYHPVNNPKGARCAIFDHHVNVFGRDPKTGFVRRPIDNVGVQYGLKALNDGVISKAQFIDLNATVGGYDVDGNVVKERTVADPIAIRAAYETGRMLNGGGGLAYTPVIDFRGYADMQKGGNVHPRFFSFSTKERLKKANGHLDNFIMLTVDGDRYGLFSMRDPVAQEAFAQMDTWLTRLKADNSSASMIDKVRRAKPADLVNACWTRGPVPTKIVEEQKDSDEPNSKCQQLYPSGSFARGVAGSSIKTDIVKCQLKPITPADYKQSFTAEEMNRLKQIFPNGVCDWSKPGVEQRGLRGTWLVIPTPAT